MSIAKKLQGGGGSFGALAHPDERGQAEAAARSEALDATGRVRRSSRAPLSSIVFNPLNPRKTIVDESIEELAESLRRQQIVPITVVSREAFLDAHPEQAAAIGAADFIALDGNRRLLAANRAGLEVLRVDLNDDLVATASDMMEAALVANAHREDLLPFEEAQAIEQLLDTVYGGNQAEVARKLGKSRAWVGQRLSLLHLTPELQEQAGTGELPIKEARKIGAEARAGKLSPAQQKERAQAAREAAQTKASARAASGVQGATQDQADVNRVYTGGPATEPEVGSRPNEAADVNPVYTGLSISEPAGSDGPREGGDVNPVYTQGVPEQRPAAPEGSAGTVTLLLNPLDAVETAKAIRAEMDSRQVSHLVSALLTDGVSPEEVAGALAWHLAPLDLERVTQSLQERRQERSMSG
ncbi:ParB/RepB/Spo0J family partition protein [Streptacidiphilus rugosus]|uniref:ParB/RepB/Spo0J family partition protein n=1 Tax=Streptacidiphilus rugosus TaxID=405783 RepID=UPI00068BD6B2|nr:ParB/RepB/Spo0J family partition protein [Streptacidiphilus rugosus]